MGKAWASLAFAVMTLVSANTAQAVTIGYSGIPGSTISFSGGKLTFLPAFPTANLQIDSGSAAGKLGDITGTFAIGTITTTSTIFGDLSTAPVTGSGTFFIDDGATDFWLP